MDIEEGILGGRGIYINTHLEKNGQKSRGIYCIDRNRDLEQDILYVHSVGGLQYMDEEDICKKRDIRRKKEEYRSRDIYVQYTLRRLGFKGQTTPSTTPLD
jgi:hypothetical protein